MPTMKPTDMAECLRQCIWKNSIVFTLLQETFSLTRSIQNKLWCNVTVCDIIRKVREAQLWDAHTEQFLVISKFLNNYKLIMHYFEDTFKNQKSTYIFRDIIEHREQSTLFRIARHVTKIIGLTNLLPPERWWEF